LSLRILLIDDEPSVLEVIALMLTFDGHTVLTATNAPQALARLEGGESVDLVLTDLMMPELNGWEVVRAVRRQWPAIRVGVITATPRYCTDRREAVDVLLKKPVTLESLREAMACIP
jgi:CheY-like chemotaxis protein